jgi:hypothetical protein
MLLAAALCFSCKEKKQTNIIIAKKPTVSTPAKPQKMGDYNLSRRVEWKGSTYTIQTQLKAVDSLPLASDGNKRYYDNTITLRIVRADGSEFFKRTFKKTDFKSYVDDIYYKDGALLGIVFVGAKGDNLQFAASVGNPDKSSDEYVPLVLSISSTGGVTISKDTQLDTGSEDDMEDEE